MGQFGEELRREREDRGISVEQICAVTKVSSRHVAALEAGQFDELPGGVFRKGIVRSYLAAVGLDEQVWVKRFEAGLYENGARVAAEQDWSEFAENVKRNRLSGTEKTGLRWFGVVMMLLALLVCGWLVWKFVLHGRLPAVKTITQAVDQLPNHTSIEAAVT